MDVLGSPIHVGLNGRVVIMGIFEVGRQDFRLECYSVLRLRKRRARRSDVYEQAK